MILKKISYSLFILLLIIASCYFDPTYTNETVENPDNVTIVLENGDDIELIEVKAVKSVGSQKDSVYFFQEYKGENLEFYVKPGKDRVFTINGYISGFCLYTKTFTAEIKETDTVFVVRLDEIVIPVPDVPDSVKVRLLENAIVEMNWKRTDNAAGYRIYRKEDLSDDAQLLAVTPDISYKDNSVTVYKTYHYAVSAYSYAGESDTSAFYKIYVSDQGPTPEPPGNISLELLQDDVVKVTWDASENTDGYIIYRTNDISSPADSIGFTDVTEYYDSKVSSERTHWYAVKAYNVSGLSDFSSFMDIYIPGIDFPPDVPQDLATKDIAETSITLSWTRSKGASVYRIFRVKGGGSPSQCIDSTDNTTYVNTGLEAMTLYSYAVSAKNSKGESQKSPKVSATTLTPVPEIPENVKAETQSDVSIRITWNEIKYAEEYEVYRSDKEDGNYLKDGSSETTNTHISSGLNFQTTYYYKVKAKNSGGISDFSEVASAKTLEEIPDPPDKPVNVSAKVLSPFAILIEWPLVQNASSYTVYCSESSTGIFSSVGTAVDGMYADSGLNEQTWYYYKVSASNNAGESEKSDVASAQTMIVIKIPTGLDAEALSDSTVELTWNSVVGADEYPVYRSDTQNGTYLEVAVADQTTYTDNGLTENTSYFYKISAKGQAGESLQTNPVEVTTKMKVPDIPDGIQATALTATEIEIEFNTVSSADGYIIYSNESLTGTYDSVATVGSSPFTHTGLDPDTKYYYKVSAFNNGGESALSDAADATTLLPPPDTPTNVDAKAQSYSEIEVTYNSVSNADGYIIYHATSSTGQYTALDSITSTSFTHDDLDPSSKHYYKVSAYNSIGESDKSNAVNETTFAKKVAYITKCVGCGRCPNPSSAFKFVSPCIL